MPFKAPRIRSCGYRVSAGLLCACQLKRMKERNARYEVTRPNARQRGYTRSWDRERAIYLKANPSCRRCNARATVVDHIQPHKGNDALFWNRANWQPLCATCHNRAKQAQEHRDSSP